MLTSYSAPREMKCPDVSYLQPRRCPAGVASWTRSARSCATWSSPRAARYPVSAKIRGERSKDVNEISPVQFEINFVVTFREIRNDIKNTLWWSGGYTTDICRRVGTCMDLKSCYKYFKIYAFTSRDTWVMGLYNTCSYQSARGRQVFGVCCNNELPAQMPVEEEETNTQVSRRYLHKPALLDLHLRRYLQNI